MNRVVDAIVRDESFVKLSMKKKLVLELLEQLPEDEKNILALHYQKEIQVKEIATMLGCSVSSVYTKLNRAIFKIRNKIAPEAYGDMYRILYPERGRPVSQQ